MFDFIKRKFREAIIDPISDSVREKQEQLAETASEYAAPSVFYLLFAITGAVAVILVETAVKKTVYELLKPSTDADVTIPLVEAEVLEETEIKRLEQH